MQSFSFVSIKWAGWFHHHHQFYFLPVLHHKVQRWVAILLLLFLKIQSITTTLEKQFANMDLNVIILSPALVRYISNNGLQHNPTVKLSKIRLIPRCVTVGLKAYLRADVDFVSHWVKLCCCTFNRTPLIIMWKFSGSWVIWNYGTFCIKLVIGKG